MKRMKNKKWVKFGSAFLVSFLLMFMLLIFGPAEIFFSNSAEFEFLYQEFAGYLVAFALAGTIGLTVVTGLLPDKIYRVVLSLLFAVSLGGYIQVMFLNKGLDLLGLNPEGYQVPVQRQIGNLLIWVAIAGVILVLAFAAGDLWKKLIPGLSAFLLCIQVVALVSLTLTADEGAYKRPDGSWHLSGEEQYVVSGKENVIVFVLDWFSNQYVDSVKKAYPDAFDCLSDFTYYSNMDCGYFGTFPSLNHMFTGTDVDSQITINEWCQECWNGEKATAFYTGLADRNYKANVYTPDTNILCGTNDVGLLQGKLSNVVNSSQDVEIRHKLLCRTMAKMSGYRFSPEVLKPSFYTDMNEYANVVVAKDNPIQHDNYAFYDGLKAQGLTVDNSSNYFIVQHLMGTHLYDTDAEGHYKEDVTMEETARGCMTIVNDYLQQLKDAGVYDDATIIVTADHGGYYDSQVIFFIKEPGEQHEESPVTDAPVSFCELLPTLAEAAGLESSEYGQTIYDFKAGEKRERTVWLRGNDPAYPAVPNYYSGNTSSYNVYFGYTYTGDAQDLFKALEKDPSCTVGMKDSYF